MTEKEWLETRNTPTNYITIGSQGERRFNLVDTHPDDWQCEVMSFYDAGSKAMHDFTLGCIATEMCSTALLYAHKGVDELTIKQEHIYNECIKKAQEEYSQAVRDMIRKLQETE